MFAISKLSRLLLAHVAEHAGLSLTCLQNPRWHIFPWYLLVNPLTPSGLVDSYSMAESICNFRGIWLILFLILEITLFFC